MRRPRSPASCRTRARITCLGPHSLRFTENPSWELLGASIGQVTATLPISFHHYIDNHLPQAIQVDLTLSPTLALNWRLYRGTWDEPDLKKPLALPVTVGAGDVLDFWLISDPLPAGAAPGPQSVEIAGWRTSHPGEVLRTSDLFWAGPWLAPPPVPGGGGSVFVPLVTRGSLAPGESPD